MRCRLILPGPRPLRWHGALAAALAGEVRLEVAVRDCHAADAPSHAITALLTLDRVLHGHKSSALDAIPPADLPHTISASDADGGSDTDLIIDVSGHDASSTAHGQRTLVPLFDGLPGPAGLWSALLDERAPDLALADSHGGGPIAIGLPALETPWRLCASADAVTARMIEGIARTVRQIAAGRALARSHTVADAAARGSAIAAARFATHLVSGKAKRLLQRRLLSAPQWRVAWRPSERAAGLPQSPLHIGDWHSLPDDGQRYYADPFVIADEGRRHIFVEELPYATGRGIISHFEIGLDGRASTPRPVLERPFHLSYPQVFIDEGVIYMLPEAAQSGCLTLYRADPFPTRWIEDVRLVDRPLHDATLLRHQGTYWLFASTQVADSSTWDALSLFHAPSLKGPWSPHPANPVLLDAGAARPAGALFMHSGDLWRPAQDCRRGYGAALTFARVERLDGDTYRQTNGPSIVMRGASKVAGPHTWNTGAGLDMIDVFAARPLPGPKASS